jgi:hypothetical protein
MTPSFPRLLASSHAGLHSARGIASSTLDGASQGYQLPHGPYCELPLTGMDCLTTVAEPRTSMGRTLALASPLLPGPQFPHLSLEHLGHECYLGERSHLDVVL